MPNLIVLAGPTAVGKTELSLEIAEHYGCPIISADSRQVYKELKIGTAAPTAQQLARVEHFLVGHRSISEYYSAYEFEQDVIKLLEHLFASQKVVLMTGGSMMYIDAVCNGIDDIPTISDDVRHLVWTTYEKGGLQHMLAMLETLDPEFYKTVDHHNAKRIIHAIEICLMAGKPYSSLRTNSVRQRPFNTIRIALNRDRAELFERINMRVEQMMADGLEAEAREFYPMRQLNSLNTVGYKELFDYFDGKISREEAIRLIQRNTRHYAKKQLTWFRLRNDYKWFEPNQKEDIIKYIDESLKD